MRVMTLAGDNRVDIDHALLATKRINAAMNSIQCTSQGITDLAQSNQADCVLIADPFQRHAGNVRSQYL